MSRTVEGPVRVRFAPSPTGFLHVGGARTAIYNDLLRHQVGGAFLLRIEDTDRARSDEAMTRQIQEALAWVGVEWDEGPCLQSERVERHRERAAELLAAGRAYRCFCSPEELAALRREAERRGAAFRYPGTCRPLPAGAAERRAAAGEPFVVRFALPREPIRFHDLVRGDMEFPQDALDDFILLRSDGSPTYHLSVVTDDIDMRITHVIRGEDHLSNTPKHIALFEAFESPVPVFAHLPLILGADRRRLSKRTGATSVEEFRAQGILPQALYNYLALLGWSPGDEREILSREEMIAAFAIDRLSSSAAIFDPDKLSWVNAQYLSSLPLAEVEHHLEPFAVELGLAGVDRERLAAAVDLHRSRARTLGELAAMVVPYFRPQLVYEPAAAAKFLADGELPAALEELARRYADLEDFSKEPLEEALRGLAGELGRKAGELIHPTRMALTAVKVGPPLFDVAALMGRQSALGHLTHFAAFLRAQGADGAPPPRPG